MFVIYTRKNNLISLLNQLEQAAPLDNLLSMGHTRGMWVESMYIVCVS